LAGTNGKSCRTAEKEDREGLRSSPDLQLTNCNYYIFLKI
jgi:hypothetical protein